jgi:hypothetical protein
MARLWPSPRGELGKTAEGEGFEPPGTCIPKLFKSFAFGRSAIPPDNRERLPETSRLPGGPPRIPVGDALDRGTGSGFEVAAGRVGNRQ